MISGVPLFRGRDNNDQLNQIIRILGTPDEATLRRIASESVGRVPPKLDFDRLLDCPLNGSHFAARGPAASIPADEPHPLAVPLRQGAPSRYVPSRNRSRFVIRTPEADPLSSAYSSRPARQAAAIRPVPAPRLHISPSPVSSQFWRSNESQILTAVMIAARTLARRQARRRRRSSNNSSSFSNNNSSSNNNNNNSSSSNRVLNRRVVTCALRHTKPPSVCPRTVSCLAVPSFSRSIP
jgi:hypothetical protein